jgi:predicted ribosomally synthesized peptide with SipW-like signal peptide
MITTKKKTGLLVLAVALVAVLAVAGTLMLFTAQSETATNTVTIGSAEIQLWESDGGDYQLTDSSNPWNFGNDAIPGDTITKKPVIKNVGDMPVYVYVALELSAYDTDNNLIDFTDPDNIDKYFDGSQSDAQAVFASFLGTGLAVNQTNWHGRSDFTFNNGKVQGGFYYIEAGVTDSLGKLPVNAFTPDVFTQVTVPTELTGAFSGVRFELDLTGYAVQSDNNPWQIGDSRIDAFDGLFN